MADDDGQTTLVEFDDDGDRDELRETVDRLANMVATLAESHDDLATVVEDALIDDADSDEFRDTVDAGADDDPRGFR